LSAGRVDAATAFWNAEGVALTELGVPTREFRVGDFAAEPFPELVVVTTRELAETEPEVVEAMQAGLERGYGLAAETPDEALEDFLSAVDGLERGIQEEQMLALSEADAFYAGVTPGALEPERYANWERFARTNGIAVP
jgi:ABC-type nitrate/sulfonate/bicarbonate transport system substrate-binding protein